MKILLPLAALASLSACVTTGAPAGDAVTRAAAAFARARPAAEALIPLLPAEMQPRARLALIAAEIALGEAQRATTPADRADALAAMEAALAEITTAAR